MRAVYHSDDRLGDQGKATSGISNAFHLGLQTSKGHVKDKYSHKAEICKHVLPSAIACQPVQVCLHVQV